MDPANAEGLGLSAPHFHYYSFYFYHPYSTLSLADTISDEELGNNLLGDDGGLLVSDFSSQLLFCSFLFFSFFFFFFFCFIYIYIYFC